MGITYCRGLALTKWSRFWFFPFTENKRGMNFLFFCIFFYSSWEAYQCEHMVKGEEGLKLQPNLMAAPGFELVVAEIVVPPPLHPLLFFPNVKTLNKVTAKRSSGCGHAGVLSRSRFPPRLLCKWTPDGSDDTKHTQKVQRSGIKAATWRRLSDVCSLSRCQAPRAAGRTQEGFSATVSSFQPEFLGRHRNKWCFTHTLSLQEL